MLVASISEFIEVNLLDPQTAIVRGAAQFACLGATLFGAWQLFLIVEQHFCGAIGALVMPQPGRSAAAIRTPASSGRYLIPPYRSRKLSSASNSGRIGTSNRSFWWGSRGPPAKQK